MKKINGETLLRLIEIALLLVSIGIEAQKHL
jgi:hypothetical protein